MQDFKNYLLMNGKSDRYVYPVRKFLDYIAGRDITQEVVDAYMLECSKKYSPANINFIINALKALFTQKKLVLSLPKYAKVIKSKPVSLSMEFVEDELLPAIEVMDFKNAIRVKALLMFMCYTGIRKNEVILLKRSQFDLDDCSIKMYIPKTKKEHIFLFPKKVAEQLKLYFMSEAEETNAFNLGKQSINRIFEKIKPYFKDVDLFPHICKKTAVTYLYSKGFRAEEISVLVGISVRTLNEHYLDIRLDNIKKDYQKRIK